MVANSPEAGVYVGFGKASLPLIGVIPIVIVCQIGIGNNLFPAFRVDPLHSVKHFAHIGRKSVNADRISIYHIVPLAGTPKGPQLLAVEECKDAVVRGAE